MSSCGLLWLLWASWVQLAHSKACGGERYGLSGTLEYLGAHGTQAVWQIPTGTVRKVLFIAHGRGSLPSYFWDPSPGCPECTGLPENRAIVLDALSRNYAVIAISCLMFPSWNWRVDTANVLSILSGWTKSHNLQGISWVALGISGGGDFISGLPSASDAFESMTIMVSGGLGDSFFKVSGFPPTLFVHMPKDENTHTTINRKMHTLRESGVPVQEVQWWSVPVTPDWFGQRIRGLSCTTSLKLWAALKSGSALDEQNYLLLPPSDFDWRSIIYGGQRVPIDADAIPRAEDIEMELKVAYANHSLISLKDRSIFDWFDGSYREVLDSS